MHVRHFAFGILFGLHLACATGVAPLACGHGESIRTVTVSGQPVDICVSSSVLDYAKVTLPSSWVGGVVSQAALPKGVSASSINISGERGRTVNGDLSGVDYSWEVDITDALGNRYSRTVSAGYQLSRFFAVENPRVVLRVIRAALEDLGSSWIESNGIAPGAAIPLDAGHHPLIVHTASQNVPLADPSDNYPSEPILTGGRGTNKPNPDKIYQRRPFGTGRQCKPSEARDVWANYSAWDQLPFVVPDAVTAAFYKPSDNQVVAVYHGVGGRPVTPCGEGDQTILWMAPCTKVGDPCTYGYVCHALISCASWVELGFVELKQLVLFNPDLLRSLLPKIGVRDSAFLAYGNSPGDGQIVTWPFSRPVLDWVGFEQPFDDAPPYSGVGGSVVKPDEQPVVFDADWSAVFGEDYPDEGADPPLDSHVVDLPLLAGEPWTNRACPQPRVITMSFRGPPFDVSFNFDWACWWLNKIRPIFLSFGAILAIRIFLNALRND